MARFNRQDYKTALPQLEKEIEEVKNSMAKSSDLLDFFYPVGTVYETANADFNPNETWGGTWEKIEGKMLIGLDSSDTYFDTVGETGGNKGMFSHTHGNKSLVGSWYATGRFPDSTNSSGIITDFSGSSSYYFSKTSSSASNTKGFNIDASHEHDSVGDSSNTDANIGNMPPYEVVVIWKRIS